MRLLGRGRKIFYMRVLQEERADSQFKDASELTEHQRNTFLLTENGEPESYCIDIFPKIYATVQKFEGPT
jgi:hypothetical protein